MFMFISIAVAASFLILLGIYFWDFQNRRDFMAKLKKLLKLNR